MSSCFHQQTQIMIGKHIDSYPLLKINWILDWQPETFAKCRLSHPNGYLNNQVTVFSF